MAGCSSVCCQCCHCSYSMHRSVERSAELSAPIRKRFGVRHLWRHIVNHARRHVDVHSVTEYESLEECPPTLKVGIDCPHEIKGLGPRPQFWRRNGENR